MASDAPYDDDPCLLAEMTVYSKVFEGDALGVTLVGEAMVTAAFHFRRLHLVHVLIKRSTYVIK